MKDAYALANNKAIWSDKLKSQGWTLVRNNCYMTDSELKDMAFELVEWAKSTDAIKASMFPVHYNVSQTVFGMWCARCPELEDAYDTAKHIIGERRERMALEGKYNASIVIMTMPLYDKDFFKMRQDMAKASKGTEGSQQTIVVVRDKFPETEVVKAKSYEGTE